MIMHSILHFSIDFGLRMLGRGIWYLGDAIVSFYACWILYDGGNRKCCMTHFQRLLVCCFENALTIDLLFF